ncbi:superoxide dismutase [Alphaproteobacteria bacterium]|jgi:Fe-Mn family superoxide dismutase|nr:superoxide dismutase [Alphaproteobacteria bacterium]MDB9872721.1 superoxide dismutase [Alphaproteobacteria bacterium]|tara:strand:+ start:152 stop:751 length:600 start_codon:yes stop_codon:yes gene_type:complete
MTLTLSDLPYSHDALASNGMSKETLEYHHDIHHKAYVDNGNNLLKNTAWENKKIEDIIVGTYDTNNIVQNGIFNNVSQHWNHEQFWQMMSPKKVNIPSELENELINSFESIEKFKEQFSAAGATQFGSGWCWLVKDKDNNLKITKTENGVNPICFGQTALLGCDVWEHSYYIDFRNKRPVYLSNFLENLVNWEYVASKL